MLTALSNCILKIEHGIKTSHRPEDRLLGERFLAYLAPVLASAELSAATVDQLQGFERLVGISFLVDPKPFSSFFDDWRDFKEQAERLLVAGMTVNERLSLFHLFDEYDHLVATKNWLGLEQLLKKVYIDGPSIQKIIHNEKSRA